MSFWYFKDFLWIFIYKLHRKDFWEKCDLYPCITSHVTLVTFRSAAPISSSAREFLPVFLYVFGLFIDSKTDREIRSLPDVSMVLFW